MMNANAHAALPAKAKDVEHKIEHHNQDNQEDKQKKVEYEHGQWMNVDDMGKNAS